MHARSGQLGTYLFSKRREKRYYGRPCYKDKWGKGERRLPVYSVYLDMEDNVSITGKDIDLFASMDLAIGVFMREDISRMVTRLFSGLRIL